MQQKIKMDTQQTLFDSPPMSQADIENCLVNTKKELGNVRRGLFRRYGEIEEEFSELKRELAAIKDLLGIKTDESTNTIHLGI